MRKLNFYLDCNSLQNIDFAFVRPIMGYADVVWYEADKLEKIQLEAARIVKGTTKLVSTHFFFLNGQW